METEQFISKIQQLEYEYEYRSYSGRYMYGEKCLGIEIESVSDVLGVILDLMLTCDTKDESYEMSDILRGAKWDELGKGYILYFPQLEYSED